MNYETAKDLKEAGFSQEGNGYLSCGCDDLRNDHTEKQLEESLSYDCKRVRYYKPTLEELLEACGPIAFSLHRGDGADGFFAVEFRNEHIPEWFEGPTPTEAVAKLWLALNSKKPV